MPTRPDLSRLTTSQLHELTGRNRRWIKKRLAEKGIEPAEETARERRYRAREALAALYAMDGLDPAQEQARLARARAEAAEFDLAVKRGEHVPAGDLEVALIALASMTQQRILAVPNRTAAELAADSTTAGCYAIVEKALHEALHALADAVGRARRARVGRGRGPHHGRGAAADAARAGGARRGGLGMTDALLRLFLAALLGAPAGVQLLAVLQRGGLGGHFLPRNGDSSAGRGGSILGAQGMLARSEEGRR